MRKELCPACESSQRCYYEGTALRELKQAEEFGRGDLCPQLKTLINEAEGTAPVQETPQVIVQPENTIQFEEPLEEIKPEVEPEELSHETPDDDVVTDVVAFAIFAEGGADPSELNIDDVTEAIGDYIEDYIEESKPETVIFTLVQPTHKPPTKLNGNGDAYKTTKYKATKNKVDKEAPNVVSNVSIRLSEYIDIDEYVLATKIPDHLWDAFSYIANAVDSVKKYPVDLDPKEKARLSRKVQNIIRANGVFLETTEAARFLLSLQLLLKSWTLNTKGKSRDEIAPFIQ